MSTAGNQRVTRSASKARSTGAESTGAASRARSRRSGSAAPLEEDKPAIGNQVTRAYGTEGKSAQAQLLSAQIGMKQAVNPIATAVSKAQAPQTPNAYTPGRLAALSEEPEDSEESEESDQPSQDYHINRRPPSIDSHDSEPPTQRSFFHSLLPRRYRYSREGLDRTSNNIITDSIRGHINASDEPQIERDVHWSRVVFLRDALLILSLLFGIMWLYESSRTRIFGFGTESGISKDVNVSLPTFQFLHHRVTKVEQQIQDLSLSTTSSNAAAAKPQINWFTLGFGPVIDFHLSSPTVLGCDPTWTPEGWPWSMFKSQKCPEVTLSLPHYAALSPWSDPVDDSWCAPPSNGKFQLTVTLPRTITPTELVVEHAAMDEMPAGFMGSSPREVELWIHVPNDQTRAALIDAITHTNPFLLEDSSPQGKTLGSDQALPFDFVPVGRWEYDIWTNQRLQTFVLPLPLAHYGVSTSKVAVRVNSNWGNVRFTCVSRLRLHGEDTSSMTEELDIGMTA